MFQTASLRVELADKVRAIGTGGIGLVQRLAEQTGLVDSNSRRRKKPRTNAGLGRGLLVNLRL